MSSGRLHWYTGTRVTIAPRASRAFSSSTFGTPYSCTAMLIPFSDRPRSSSALIRSRHVFGSGTTIVGCRLFSRSTAKGLGPRTTVMVLPRAASICARGQRVSSTFSMKRVPTPVRRITRSNSPASRRSPKRSTSAFSSSGTSRMDGATSGRPPYRSMSCLICSAIRLSKAATRSPANPTCSPSTDMDDHSDIN